MKLEFNSDDDLPLKKTLELYNMMIVVRSVFYEEIVQISCYACSIICKCYITKG